MSCTTLEHALAADKSGLQIEVWDGYSWSWENTAIPTDGCYTPLHAYGLIVTDDGWTLGSADPALTLVPTPGMPGSVDQTEEAPGLAAYPARRKVEINLAAVGDPSQIQEAMANAGGWSGKRLRIIGLLPDPRLAVEGRASMGKWALKYRAGGELVAATGKLSLDALPYAYAPTEHAALTAGANSVTIKGNAPIRPFVSLDSQDSSTAPQGVEYRPDTNHSYLLKAAQSSSTGWSFWCAERVCKLGSDYAGGEGIYGENAWLDIAMTADWLELAPGAITLSSSTTGFIEYEPAYLF